MVLINIEIVDNGTVTVWIVPILEFYWGKSYLKPTMKVVKSVHINCLGVPAQRSLDVKGGLKQTAGEKVPVMPTSRGPLTLKFDMATRPFLKIDMRHEAYRHGQKY